jgi:hypothetical protein
VRPKAIRLVVVPVLAAFAAVNLVFIALALTSPSFLLIRVAYDTDTLLFPALFALGALGLTLTRSGRRYPRAIAVLLVASVACFGARLYATHLEPRRLMVREATVPVAGLHAPVRLLHFSDIQSGAVGAWEERIVAKIREIDPDLIILTGDLLHPLPPVNLATELPKIRELLEGLHPPLGKFMVAGDTDSWVHRGSTEVASLHYLSGSDTVIEAPGGRIRLLGLTLRESAEPDRARRRVARWMAAGETETRPAARSGGPESDVTIVAGHRPDFALGLGDLPVDLALAGHTHGGQVRIPFYGPLITLSQVPRDWARGFRRIDGPWLNVSAGLGNEHTAGLPALRVFCPPEMTLITLHPAGLAVNAPVVR